MNPAMDMRLASEVPKHVGPFDLPDVPHSIISHILLLEERQAEIFQPLGLHQLHGLLRIRLAERGEQFPHHPLNQALLVFRQIPDPNSGQARLLSRELHRLRGSFSSPLAVDKGDRALASVECLEDLIHFLGLMPEDVPGMICSLGVLIARLVTIEDWASERRSRNRIPITTSGAVTSRENEFKFPRLRMPEQGDRSAPVEALPFGVVNHLRHGAIGELGGMEVTKDLLHEVLLIRLQGLGDRFFGDQPVVVDLLP